MKTLEELKQEAASVTVPPENVSVEHQDQRKMLEDAYQKRAEDCLATVSDAVKQAHARGVNRALIGRIKNDYPDPWGITESWRPRQTDLIPRTIQAGLPAGVELRIEDAASFLQGSDLREGIMKGYFVDEKPSIVDVYVPQSVVQTKSAHAEELFLLLRWN